MKLGINERLKGKKLYKEIWKPVITDEEDYTGLYEVSNMGKIRSIKSNKILKGCKEKDGYLLVNLYKNGKKKMYKVHRLVAFAFVKGYFEGAIVDHINTIKDDNRVINLKWVTYKQNNNNPKSIQKKNKRVVCVETGQIFNSMKEAGEYVSIDSTHIVACCKGKRKICGGFHWEYYEEVV